MSSFQFQADMYNSITSEEVNNKEDFNALKSRVSILENQMADLLRQNETESVLDVCMTNEEAIEILKSKMDGSVDTSYEFGEAVRMAIRALKEQQAYSEMKKPGGAEMETTND